MKASEAPSAVAACIRTASALDLSVDEAVIVHDSNRLAVRLLPCDVLARVAPLSYQAVAAFEVEVARHLPENDCPLAELDPRVAPRVYVHDGFAITVWTYYEPVASVEVSPAEFARALVRLHAGMRQIEVSAPHFTDRVIEAHTLVADREQTPELLPDDRRLLSNALSRLGNAISEASTGEQLLHGEPHLGNLLRTRRGLLFVDLETCCRGPVEFDIAHGLLPSEKRRMLNAEGVREQYPGARQRVIDQCRILIWAMITTWRWQRDDQLPNGRYWRIEGLHRLRAALHRVGLDVSGDEAYWVG